MIDLKVKKLEQRVKALEAAIVKIAQPELKVIKNRFIGELGPLPSAIVTGKGTWIEPDFVPVTYGIGDRFKGPRPGDEEYILAQTEAGIVNLIGTQCGNRHSESMTTKNVNVHRIPAEMFHAHFTLYNPNARSSDDRLPFTRVYVKPR